MAKGKGEAAEQLGKFGLAWLRNFARRGGGETAQEAAESVLKRVTRNVPKPPRRAPRKPTTLETVERYFVRPEGYEQAATGATRAANRATRRTGGEVATTVTRGPRAPRTQKLLFGKDYATKGPVRKVASAAWRAGKFGTIPYLGLVSTGVLDVPGIFRGGKEKGYDFDPGTGTTTFTDASGNIFAVDPASGAMTQVGTDPQQAALARISEQQLQAELGNYPGAEDEVTYGEEGMGSAGDYGYGSDYSDLRASANKLAQNLRGYGTAKGTGMRDIYSGLSQEAAADAVKAEAIARAAYEDIGRIGRDYSAGATADITSPGAGGPTELTGLTPVTGESYDIPGRIADTSQIAADYVLRDLNLTRDDLNYMSSMARMMGPAYEAQLNDSINLAIANKMFELDQYIAEQQGADRRFAAEQAALDRRFALEQGAATQREREAAARQAYSDYYDRQLAQQALAGGSAQLGAAEYQGYLEIFQSLVDSEKGRQTLRGIGIDPSSPNAFQQFLAREQRVAAGQVAGS